MTTYASVTVGIPAYNEATTIEQVIRSFLLTKYPDLIEIIIADGGSTDSTQDIVKKLSLEDSRVKLLHNPLKIQSAGLNLILQQCRGDIFLRADAHCEYAPDYIERCVEALIESKASSVSGAQRAVATTAFQAGVALAFRSFLANGGSKLRNPNYDGYSDTNFMGCFWKKDILQVALYKQSEQNEKLNLSNIEYFDTSQVTNQDAELNLRLIEKNPKAIYISSKIKVCYHPRKTWKTLWKQYFKYGRGRYLTSLKHPKKSPLRSKIPFIALLLLVFASPFTYLFPQISLFFYIFLFICFLIPFLEGIRTTLKYDLVFNSEIWRSSEKVPSIITRCLFCGVAILTMPLAHSFGYTYQLFRHKILRAPNW
ncbi:glycosyl transferase [Mastigocoleus testarum BC008]|uniref:Glycosyl transferase n=1 Tax=Mastigocoleus testarum BC008 TaxID=371196 RepID=A0A0V7ZNL6_9CYAN|nr:glycosyl transferase [Mastigocoleus testarum BC008]